MVLLDSNHIHDHVLAELEAYGPMVSSGSYCVVFDTVIEYLPDGLYSNRPWARGNNPMTAVDRFLSRLATENIATADGEQLCFANDSRIDSKLLIPVAPGGYLPWVRMAGRLPSGLDQS
jgi:cephalosporin hydroxylase